MDHCALICLTDGPIANQMWRLCKRLTLSQRANPIKEGTKLAYLSEWSHCSQIAFTWEWSWRGREGMNIPLPLDMVHFPNIVASLWTTGVFHVTLFFSLSSAGWEASWWRLALSATGHTNVYGEEVLSSKRTHIAPKGFGISQNKKWLHWSISICTALYWYWFVEKTNLTLIKYSGSKAWRLDFSHEFHHVGGDISGHQQRESRNGGRWAFTWYKEPGAVALTGLPRVPVARDAAVVIQSVFVLYIFNIQGSRGCDEKSRSWKKGANAVSKWLLSLEETSCKGWS